MKIKHHFLLTNGTVARGYLARLIVVPASLRIKDPSYTDLSNVAGDRLVLLNDPVTTPQLRDSVLFSGWDDHGVSLEARAQVLIELPFQKMAAVSPNNYFSVLEGQVIAIGSQVKLYVADEVTRTAFLDFLNRYGDFDTSLVSVEILDGLSNGVDTEEMTKDLEWLKLLPRAKPPAKSEFERMERIASAILVTAHHAAGTVQRDSVAALFVRRPLPKGVLGSIVEHRKGIEEAKDPVFQKIANLVLSANLVSDAKAAALENSWVSKIRMTLKVDDTIRRGIIDDIEAFLDNNILWHEIKDLDKHPALHAFVLFLRDSGKLPKLSNDDSENEMSDTELASCYLSGLFHLRSQILLEYRQPVESEAMIAALVSSSVNNKLPFLEFLSSEHRVIFEDGVLTVNGQQITPRVSPESIKVEVSDRPILSTSVTGKVDTWEIETSQKVVVEINGLKQTFNPTTVITFSFLHEPVVKKNARDVIPTVKTEPLKADNGIPGSLQSGERRAPIRSSGRQSSRTDYKNVEESSRLSFDAEPPEPPY